MARTNYQYEKRQRDLAKKKKKEEKRLKKLNKQTDVDQENSVDSVENVEAAGNTAESAADNTAVENTEEDN